MFELLYLELLILADWPSYPAKQSHLSSPVRLLVPSLLYENTVEIGPILVRVFLIYWRLSVICPSGQLTYLVLVYTVKVRVPT